MSREADIEAVLSRFDPGATVRATREADGSRIVVEVSGQTYRFSVGKGRSALVNYLLTGYATSAASPRHVILPANPIFPLIVMFGFWTLLASQPRLPTCTTVTSCAACYRAVQRRL
jgi:hypothetical protein